MLNKIRDTTKSFTTKIFLLLIAASFALWGVGDIFSNKQDPVLVQIGEENITASEFLNTYQRILSEVRRNSNVQITDEIALSYNMHHQTLNQMINEKIVDLEVKKIGFVSKERLRNSILSSPYFKDQLGQFSQEQYDYTLRQLRMNEKEYLKDLSKSIMREQIYNIFDYKKEVPSFISEIYYRLRNEQRDVKTIIFSSRNYQISKDITISNLKKFHENNPEKYTFPENRSFYLMSLKPADIIESIELSEEELKNEFDSFPEKYSKLEEREIYLVNTETEQEANDLINQITDNSKFLEEASSFLNKNIDSLNLGFLTFQDLPQDLAEKSFQANINEIQGPEETPFGWRVYLVNNIKNATKVSFLEVRETISKELKTSIAIDKLYDLGNIFYDEIASGSSAIEAAKSINANIKKFNKVDINGINHLGEIVEELPPYPELLETVFTTKLNDTSNLINTIGNIMFAVHIDEINLPRAMTVEEAKDKIINDIKDIESLKAAKFDAEEFIKKIKNGSNFEKLAKNSNLIVIELNNLRPDGTGSEGVLNRNAIVEIFKLNINQISPIVKYDEKSFTISKLMNITDVKDIDTDKSNAINESLSKSIANDVKDMFIKQLSTQHKIKINKNIFDRLFM